MAVDSSPVIYVLEPYGGSVRRHNPALPHIYYDDLAVTRGEGIFESVLIRKGQPVNLERHLKRFARSARQLALPQVQVDQWRQATLEAAQDFGEGDGACGWTLSRGRSSTGLATAWLTIRPLDAEIYRLREEGIKVMTTTRGYTATKAPEWLPQGAKTLNYAATMAALRYARERSFEDVIFLGDDGGVLEGATSSVVMVRKDQRLRSPSSGEEVLMSTTQKALFECAEAAGWRCKEGAISYEDLLKADSVWLVSSTRLAVRVVQLDEHELPAGKLDKDFRKLVKKTLDL